MTKKNNKRGFGYSQSQKTKSETFITSQFNAAMSMPIDKQKETMFFGSFLGNEDSTMTPFQACRLINETRFKSYHIALSANASWSKEFLELCKFNGINIEDERGLDEVLGR